MKNLEKVLKAFANIKRLQIIELLLEHDRLSLIQLSKELRLSYRSTSKHVRKLYECDILDRESVQGEVRYSINRSLPKPAKSMLELVRETRLL